ncbi:MAG TPA: TolC family protein [Gammaproteobacteria bacterium]|nr:TolC family protein [Gammaproteobacteria bacterium]
MFLPSAFIGWRPGVTAALLTVIFLLASPARATEPLTLGAAQQLALQQDPGIRQLKAETGAVRDSAAAAGQWPDPKLSFGLVDLPTNSYAVGRDPNTMQVVGIEQDFPAGDTRSLSLTRGEQLADAQTALVKDRELQVVRDLRHAWFDLYYAEHALPLVQQGEQAFQQLLDIAKVRYANGQGGEQDLARAELEMGMLEERELELNAGIDTARAALTKFVGSDAGQAPLADALPALPQPPDHEELLKRLIEHPRIVAADTQVAAADTATDIAGQGYKPSWGVDLSYGRRPGADASGMPYTNMLTAMVTVSLPLFTGNRQDRSVNAARAQASATQDARDDELRDLRQMLDTDWAHWEHLGHIRELYAKTILPNSGLNTQATLSAYRNGAVDFDELARAQITDLDSRMQQLKADTDYLGMQADLLYLAGVQP